MPVDEYESLQPRERFGISMLIHSSTPMRLEEMREDIFHEQLPKRKVWLSLICKPLMRLNLACSTTAQRSSIDYWQPSQFGTLP